jgi:hypothetical protein
VTPAGNVPTFEYVIEPNPPGSMVNAGIIQLAVGI